MEYAFVCPYCGQNISMVLDLSIEKEQFIEDCQVCCRPIEIRYEVSEDELTAFNCERIQ